MVGSAAIMSWDCFIHISAILPVALLQTSWLMKPELVLDESVVAAVSCFCGASTVACISVGDTLVGGIFVAFTGIGVFVGLSWIAFSTFAWTVASMFGVGSLLLLLQLIKDSKNIVLIKSRPSLFLFIYAPSE